MSCSRAFAAALAAAGAAAATVDPASVDPLGGWSRPSGWQPHPVQRAGANESVWIGQRRGCVAAYGNWIGNWAKSYRVGCTTGPIENDTEAAATPAASGGRQPQASEGSCAMVCFALWQHALGQSAGADEAPEDADSGSSEAPADRPFPGVPAPVAVPDLPNSSDLPLRRLSAVWSPADRKCYCAAHPLSSASAADVRAAELRKGRRCDCPATGPDAVSNNSECSMRELALPLGCLWAGEVGCIEAPADSCVWTLDGCCADSISYPWRTNLFGHPPWWAWAAGGLLVLSTCVLLVLLKRLRMPLEPIPDDPGLSQELVQQHIQDYDALLQRLVIDVPVESTMSECSVCLEPLAQPGTQCVKLPSCLHMFHLKCMKDYVQHQCQSGKRYPRCPNCRRRLCDDDAALRDRGSETESEGDSPASRRPYESPALGDVSPSAEPPAPAEPPRESPPPRAGTASSSTSTSASGGSAAQLELDGVPRVESVRRQSQGGRGRGAGRGAR